MSTVADDFEPAIENAPEKEVFEEPDSTAKIHDPEETIANFVNSGTVDFDPSIHAVDKVTGQPKRRGDGSFALKRGRKSGATSVPRETPPQNSPAPNVSRETPPAGETLPPPPARISNDEAARQACNLAIGAAVMLLGTEWEPSSKEESKFLVTSVKNYFDAKGQIQLSPEWGLAIAVLAYSAPRLRHDNTRTKIRNAALWVKDKFTSMRSIFGRKNG